MKTYTLNQVQDALLGELGKPEREKFEYELQMELIGKLNAVPSKKVERAVRSALSLDGSDQEKILAVKQEVEAAGLQKPEPPKPLDPVSENQVRLVCWMAVKGRDEHTT